MRVAVFQYLYSKSMKIEANILMKISFQLLDDEITEKVRGAIGELIKAAGKAVYNGEFSFSRISFPIKCMLDRSLL